MAPRWIFGIVLGAVVAGAFYVPGLGGDARDVSKDMLRREAEVNEDETSKDMLRREPGFRDVEVDESLKEKKKDKEEATAFADKTEKQQLRIMRELTSGWTDDARKQRIMNEYELTAADATQYMDEWNRQHFVKRLIELMTQIKSIDLTPESINLTPESINQAKMTTTDMTMMNATLANVLQFLKPETKQTTADE